MTLHLASGGVVLVLDVADPAVPQVVHDGLHTSGHVRDLRYVAAIERLYVADWRGGLGIWDVHNLQSLRVVGASSYNPEVVGSVAVSEGLNDLALAGDFVVGVNRTGLFIFDVATPTQPQQIASVPLPDGYRVRLDGDVAYVSSDDAGLQIIRAGTDGGGLVFADDFQSGSMSRWSSIVD